MIRALESSILPRRLPVVALAAGMILGATAMARADCNADFASLMNRRMAEIGALNKISKAGGGKLDPVAACPRLRSLAVAEGEVVSYMIKNKDWCNLPDDVVGKMTATHAKTESYAAKACGLVVKMKQMQAEQQKQAQSGQSQEQAIKLPTGPL
jgi:hypothetical protein